MRLLAYRVLGDMWDADDAVQNAWLKFQAVDLALIDDVDAWLTTVVSRCAVDVIRRRQSRHELPVESLADESFDAAAESGGPESVVIREDELAAAFSIVLYELSPVDRLSLILHDVFGYSFVEIADIAGTTVAGAKKRASRARQKLRNVDFAVVRDQQRAAVLTFLEAARGGNMGPLISLLDPAVVLRADANAIALAAPHQATGAPRLVPRADGPDAVGDVLSGRIADAVIVEVAGLSAIGYVKPGRGIIAVYSLTIVGGMVTRVEAIADPGILLDVVTTLS